MIGTSSLIGVGVRLGAQLLGGLFGRRRASAQAFRCGITADFAPRRYTVADGWIIVLVYDLAAQGIQDQMRNVLAERAATPGTSEYEAVRAGFRAAPSADRRKSNPCAWRMLAWPEGYNPIQAAAFGYLLATGAPYAREGWGRVPLQIAAQWGWTDPAQVFDNRFRNEVM